MEQRWREVKTECTRLESASGDVEAGRQEIARLKAEVESKGAEIVEKERQLTKLSQLSAAA